MGFAQAQDRPWQIELLRPIVQEAAIAAWGRISTRIYRANKGSV
jgi:hypothetical protein